MKNLKRAYILLLIPVLLFTLASCNINDKPLQTVKGLFSDLKKSALDKANEKTDKSVLDVGFFEENTAMSALLLDDDVIRAEIFKNVTLKSAQKSKMIGDKATVRAIVSCLDLKDMLPDYVMLLTLSGSNLPKEKAQKAAVEMLKSTKKIESEITINLEKKDGGWMILADEELADAITGGLASYKIPSGEETQSTT